MKLTVLKESFDNFLGMSSQGAFKPKPVAEAPIELDTDAMEQPSAPTSTGGSESVRKYIMFGFNYPYDLVEQVWADKPQMVSHLNQKFEKIVDAESKAAVINVFYSSLDKANQAKLLDWIETNYKG